jgi:hypothetical protein
MCFTRMFTSVSSSIAYICNSFKYFSGIFVSISDACFKCFISVFFMLQLLHLDVLKVDQIVTHEILVESD